MPPPPPRVVVVECPAKVNLHLRVGPPRADGFHPLLTWMATVGLFDTLRVRVVAEPAPAVRLRCEPPTLPADERNLVYRALSAWSARARESGGSFPPVDATLIKRTPAGAGLGGGSSDAACAILAAARLTAKTDTDGGRAGPRTSVQNLSAEDLSAEDLSAFAARFGSDIPFFLHGPSAVCTGRGEVVRPVAQPTARWGVLVLPPVVMPTPEVYRRFDAMRLGEERALTEEPDWAAWARLPAAELMARVVNDLERAAFAIRPDLDDLRRKAEDAVGRPVRMSGSGSSLFTLFDDRAEAVDAGDRLRGESRAAGLADGGVLEAAVGVPIEVRDVDSG